jgi:hypothetical protein
MMREGLQTPKSARVSGSGEIISCEEHAGSRHAVRVLVRVAGVPSDLIFAQPANYLGYVREACAAHAIVSWSAVLGDDEQPHSLVAFQRSDLPGGFTEKVYGQWWQGMRVLWIAMGVGALYGAAVAFAVTAIRSRARS